MAYVGVWYFDSLPSVKTETFGVAKGVKVVPVLFGPVVYVFFIPGFPPSQVSPNSLCRILFIRRIVQIWYQRKGDAEGEIVSSCIYHPYTVGVEFSPEKMVQTLMKERREKVEEIKKKTNYYSTLNLIQRYDETSPATPLQPRVNPGQSLPVTPQQQQRPFPNNISTNGKAVNPSLQAQLSRAFDPSPVCLRLIDIFPFH